MSNTPKAVSTAVAPAPLPETFNTQDAAKLARDIALRLYDESVILKKAGLTEGQYETLKQNQWFQALVTQITTEWNLPKNAQQRLAILSAVGLETVLPDIIARAKVSNEPLTGIAQLVKVLADMAGFSSQNRQQAPAAEKFNIVINLGADTEVYEKTRPIVVDERPTAIDDTVAEVNSGLQTLLALQKKPETP
jgi:hypothetical protein